MLQQLLMPDIKNPKARGSKGSRGAIPFDASLICQYLHVNGIDKHINRSVRNTFTNTLNALLG